MRLYRGAFLEGDAGEAWALPLRERLRGRFVRAVEAGAGTLEVKGDPAAAIDLFERGLVTDPLIEAFHQGVIHGHLALGCEAEAGGAYRRLQRTLAVAFGTQPSERSRQLIETSIRTG